VQELVMGVNHLPGYQSKINTSQRGFVEWVGVWKGALLPLGQCKHERYGQTHLGLGVPEHLCRSSFRQRYPMVIRHHCHPVLAALSRRRPALRQLHGKRHTPVLRYSTSTNRALETTPIAQSLRSTLSSNFNVATLSRRL
jgi:hypothetical protein